MNLLKTLSNGHSYSTTCVSTTHDDQCIIITGAERGEICLWSASDGILIKKIKLQKRDHVSCVVCSKLKAERFYVSAYRQVFAYDTRMLSQPLEKLAITGDCVNQIAVDDCETKLAFAEDSGEIEIFDLTQKCFTNVLEEHSNICNTALFQPDSSNIIYSGGMDNLLLKWDVDEEVVTGRIDLSEIGAYSEDLGPLPFFLVSPPFVHSLSVSRSSHHLACGTENGMVYLFDTCNKDLKCMKSYRKHNKGVSQVHFPVFSDDLLISAANDFRLCVWKVPNNESETCPLTNGNSANGSKVGQPDLSNHLGGQDKVNLGQDVPLFEMKRSEKINWLATGLVNSNGFVVVVDSTTTPTIYCLPQ